MFQNILKIFTAIMYINIFEFRHLRKVCSLHRGETSQVETANDYRKYHHHSNKYGNLVRHLGTPTYQIFRNNTAMITNIKSCKRSPTH